MLYMHFYLQLRNCPQLCTVHGSTRACGRCQLAQWTSWFIFEMWTRIQFTF